MKKLSEQLPKYDKEKYQSFLINKVLTDMEIRKFIQSNNLTKEIVAANMEKFYEYYIAKNNILEFQHIPRLVYKNSAILVVFEETEEYKKNSRKVEFSVKTEYIPTKILQATFADLSKSKEKLELATELMKLCREISAGKNYRGMYIYGPAGVGKTYLLGSTYNYLKSLGEEPAIIYFPEFVRKIKSRISYGDTDNYIESIRNQKILIIDDIGAENITEFIRDEILGPIINYREAENLTTFFSSNLSPMQLNTILSQGKNTIDSTKALRIVQRIKSLAKEYYLDGVNERENF